MSDKKQPKKVKKTVNKKPVNKKNIRTQKLSTVLPNKNYDVIKLDLQGAELEVIEGS